MNCEVYNVKVRVPVGKTGKRFKMQWQWRCRRCPREFPFDAVLNLAGCEARLDGKALDRHRAQREKFEERAVRIEKDERGKPRLVYS